MIYSNNQKAALLTKIKPILVSTWDVLGGASRAAYRLYRGLQAAGIKPHYLVQRKASDDASVTGLYRNPELERMHGLIRHIADYLPLLLYRKRQIGTWNNGFIGSISVNNIKELDGDIVHLHWTGGACISIPSIGRINRPIVWTLHDMWAFTGGCHYSGNCMSYKLSCGSCPQLGSNIKHDLSRWNWRRKKTYLQNKNITFVTPSHWLSGCVKNSSLFRNHDVRVIPNGIDINVFRPIPKKQARSIMRLPQKNKIILFVAASISDSRKGFKYLREALDILGKAGWGSKLALLVMGANSENDMSDSFQVFTTGMLHDDLSIVMAYSAADVFVAPSLEDNLPNTVMESLACGTPAVAFNIGGMPDLIDDKKCGRLAEEINSKALSDAIDDILNANSSQYGVYCRQARLKVMQSFSSEIVAERHINLYSEIVTAGRGCS